MLRTVLPVPRAASRSEPPLTTISTAGVSMRGGVRLGIGIVVMAVVIGVTAALVRYRWGYDWDIVADRVIKIYDSRSSVARAKDPVKPSVPLFTVSPGERLAVLWDTLDDDTWACYVRTEKYQYGWAVCNEGLQSRY